MRIAYESYADAVRMNAYSESESDSYVRKAVYMVLERIKHAVCGLIRLRAFHWPTCHPYDEQQFGSEILTSGAFWFVVFGVKNFGLQLVRALVG